MTYEEMRPYIDELQKMWESGKEYFTVETFVRNSKQYLEFSGIKDCILQETIISLVRLGRDYILTDKEKEERRINKYVPDKNPNTRAIEGLFRGRIL